MPQLVEPRNGAVVDNGCSTRAEDLIWEFSWRRVDGASRYHLWVNHPGARIPVIDDAGVTRTTYRTIENAYIADQNRFGWEWRVRARVAGTWSNWSPTRHFDAEPLNTDCR